MDKNTRIIMAQILFAGGGSQWYYCFPHTRQEATMILALREDDIKAGYIVIPIVVGVN
jgi:hypothetical protein